MRRIRDVLTCLFENKLSERASSTYTGINRKTVSEYRMRFAQSALPWPLPQEVDDAALEQALYPLAIPAARQARKDIDFAPIHQEMRKKGATIAVLFDEWRETTPADEQISYSQFCKLYAQFKKSLRISLRQKCVDGELGFVDYAGPTMEVHDSQTGASRTAQIFLGVLGGSSYTFCEATWSQKVQDWIESHCRMFEFFGGVPAVVVHDNLKSAVTKADRLSPIINESYAAMCRYYGTHPFAARAYRPKDKARAEVGVLIAERWILFRLRKRKFFSLVELNQAIRELLDQINMKPFQKMPGSRFGNWIETERASLQPLPATRYEFAEWGKVRVGLDYHVTVDNHTYSVPNRLRGEELEFRLTATALDLFFKNKNVVAHTRSYEEGEVTTRKEHRTKAHNAIAEWSVSESLEWAREVGSATEAFLSVQLQKPKNYLFGYRATQTIKKLLNVYGKIRLEEACAYAVQHKVSGSNALLNILARNLDRLFAQVPEQNADTAPESSTSTHENIRGAKYYDHILTNEKDKES